MNDNNSNTMKSIPDVQNPSSSDMLHSIANVAINHQCSSRKANSNQISSSTQETAPSSSHSIQRSTKPRRKQSKKAPVPSDEPNSVSVTIKKPKSTLCIAKEQSLVVNASAAVHENEQAMDTTTSPPENEDEALSQEVMKFSNAATTPPPSNAKPKHSTKRPFTSSLTRQRASNPFDFSPIQPKLKHATLSNVRKFSTQRIFRTANANLRSK